MINFRTSKTYLFASWGLLLLVIIVTKSLDIQSELRKIIASTYGIMFLLSSIGIYIAITQKDKKRYLVLNILTALLTGLFLYAIKTDFLGAIR